MNLSAVEKKLLMLAMDKAATDHEIGAAAKKFIESLRVRYPSGVELITAIEGLIVAQHVQHAAPQPSYTRPFGDEWGDIMREASKRAAERMAKEQARRQQTWEEYCNTHNFNPYQNAYRPENVQQEEPKKKDSSWWAEQVKKAFGK